MTKEIYAVAFLISNSEHHLINIFEINIDPILIIFKMPKWYLFTLQEKRNRQEREDAQERQENMTYVPFTCNVAMFFYGDNNDGYLFFCPLPIRDLVSQSSRYDRRVSGVSRHPPGIHYHHHLLSFLTKANKQTIHQCMYITRNKIIM